MKRLREHGELGPVEISRRKGHSRPRKPRSDEALNKALERKFGISLVEFKRLLAAQGGGCAICRTAIPGAGSSFHVDHDHSCCLKGCRQCIRGLLCTRHNTGVGQFGDDPELLRAAADYLESGHRPFATRKETARAS